MSSHTSRDTFLYLLHFITLAISATALGNVWFAFINRWTMSPTPYDRFSPSEVTAGLSALVIAAPIYLGLSWWMRKSFTNGTLQSTSALRRWLLYFTVFITAIIGMVDLIATLNTYLNGDFTVRFFFKALTIFVIAGAVFGFYCWDIRREQPVTSQATQMAFAATVMVTVVTIIIGFVLVGSPKTRRLLQWDQQRVDHVRSIVYDLYNRYQEGGELPDSSDRILRLQDPETYQRYEYRKVDGDTFEVCAQFTTSAVESDGAPKDYYAHPVDPGYLAPDFEVLEQHGAGRQCFEFTATRRTVKFQSID